MGDFRQLPPVIKHGSRAEVVSSCLNRSYLWRHFKAMKLTINVGLQILSFHEVSEVNEFSNFLLRVGEGTEPEDENQMIHIDTKYIIPGDSIADLVTSVYGNFHENYADHEYVRQKLFCALKTRQLI